MMQPSESTFIASSSPTTLSNPTSTPTSTLTSTSTSIPTQTQTHTIKIPKIIPTPPKITLTKQNKLLVLDFDLTLSTQRVFGTRDFDNLYELFGGYERVQLLKKLFLLLHANNIGIIIISTSFQETILAALINLGLKEYFNGVIDRRSLISYGNMHRGKHEIVKIISKNIILI